MGGSRNATSCILRTNHNFNFILLSVTNMIGFTKGGFHGPAIATDQSIRGSAYSGVPYLLLEVLKISKGPAKLCRVNEIDLSEIIGPQAEIKGAVPKKLVV